MAEDWRVTVSLGDESGRELGSTLHEHELADGASLGGRVAVSSDSSHVFLYADTEAAAEEGRRVVASILESNGKTATYALDRWHPIAAEWQPADVPLPVTEAARQSEHDQLEAKDAADTQATGHAEWEVRLDLPTHRDAVDLAERLASEGLGITRRWKYLLIGADNEDHARALAERLPIEAPAGTEIRVQPGGEMFWEGWQRRPFAWVGDVVD